MSKQPNLKSVLNSSRQVKPSTNVPRNPNSKLLYESGSTLMISESIKVSDKKYKKTMNDLNTKLKSETIEKTENSDYANNDIKKIPIDPKQLKVNDAFNKKNNPTTSSSKLLAGFEDTIKKSNK